MSITPTEQRVYRYFYKKRIFSIEECIRYLNNNYRSALVATKNLVTKSYILKIRRGLYYIIPYEKTSDWYKEFEPDKYIIAGNLLNEAFISHNTALEFYNLTDSPLQKIFLCSKQKIPDVKLNSYKFYIIKTKYFFGYKEMNYRGIVLNVSDKERTIIDCLRNINYTSGLNELLKTIGGLGDIDFEKLFDYLTKINEVSLYSRIGYVMDLLKFKLKTPDWFTNKLKGKLTERTYYLDGSQKGSSRHVKEWKLMVPEFVLKLDI